MKKLTLIAFLFSFCAVADSTSSAATLCDKDREATGKTLATQPVAPEANTGAAASQDKGEDKEKVPTTGNGG